MEKALSNIGLLSIVFLILYIIRKLFGYGAANEETEISKFEDDDDF